MLEQISFYDGSPSFASRIRPGGRYGVVGTGPGGVDSAHLCIDNLDSPFSIDMFSRQGRISKVQTLNPPNRTFEDDVERIVLEFEEEGTIDLMQVVAAFHPVFKKADKSFDFAAITREPNDTLAQLKEDILHARLDGPPYRHVLEAIGARAPRIWHCLPPDQKQVFRQRYLRLYYVFRHAMPIASAEWLSAQVECGNIRVGRIFVPIESHDKGLLARIAFAPGESEEVIFDHLIIATGPEWDVTKSDAELIRQILRDGIAKVDPLGGFSTTNFELSGSPNVFAMGGNVRGEDFAVHSLPALARHAKAIEALIRHRIHRSR